MLVRLVALLVLTTFSVLLAGGAIGGGGGALLSVDNGDLFYDTDGDCRGDTDDHTALAALALRHWHYGTPVLGRSHEPVGGYGCLGGPKTWTVTVPGGESATLSGRIRYTWDQQVAGGGANDVHLIVRDAAGGVVYATMTEGVAPIVPGVVPVAERALAADLGPGTYTVEEDVFCGAHTAWLTRLVVAID